MENNKTIEILLVEDSLSDAEMTIRALLKNNISSNLLHLKDGVEALDFLFGIGDYEGRNTDIKPKVILLDLKMPKIDGIELLIRMKSDDRTKKIPVVVLTSSNQDPDIQKCYELGVNSYIIKPVGFENFTKAIAELGYYWILSNQAPH